MKTTLLTLAVAAALAAVAGCDRAPEQRTTQTPPTSSAAGGTAAPQANTPSTPANVGTPSSAEKREGSNPVQGQVDPKDGPQQKDFQQRGDGAGPKPGR